ncbi:MAG: DUF5318 family protein [Acidimicrobiales bacterium]|nr:DUF5318 family protein [Acidimicrobiales bacterium]
MAQRPVIPPGALHGEIDYRLARQAVLADVRAGRTSTLEVCDAHPELWRAAHEVGVATSDDCPICDDGRLVHVSYVFGPRLPPFGRCITSRAELARLARRKGTFTCYVVEVCPECRWNHLTRSYVLDPPRGE